MSYDDNNIFAKILRGEIPSERVYEDDQTLVFMDIMPRADGHVLMTGPIALSFVGEIEDGFGA